MDLLWRGRHRLRLDAGTVEGKRFKLPTGVAACFRSGTNSQCLDQLAELALNPDWTFRIFSNFLPLEVEICNRWLQYDGDDKDEDGNHDLRAFCSLARLLSIRPSLAQCAIHIANERRKEVFRFIGHGQDSALLFDQKPEPLGRMLLGIYRCLAHDEAAFAFLFHGQALQTLLKHDKPYIRFLAAKIICLRLHAADAAFHQILERHHITDLAPGPWDDLEEVDYRFLDLWEERKPSMFEECATIVQSEFSHRPEIIRSLGFDDLLGNTVVLGGVLQPVFGRGVETSKTIVQSPTTDNNLEKLGTALLSSQAILVSGSAGSGKSSLIFDAAKLYGAKKSMLTLHLNEQTDTKTLIGMYASDNRPGTFKWQPGVLTTAVREGRWALIEDLDRAPSDVLSTLLPLLERRQLYVPNLGGFIKANPAFRLFGTVRTHVQKDQGNSMPSLGFLGIRHWNQIHLQPLQNHDLRAIVITKHPLLRTVSDDLLQVYDTVTNRETNPANGGHAPIISQRHLSSHDFFKCASRIANLMRDAGMVNGTEPMLESLKEAFFLEIVDCFAGFSQSYDLKASIAEAAAQILQITPQRRDHCLRARVPSLLHNSKGLHIGRIRLRSFTSRTSQSGPDRSKKPFALTHDILRRMESISAAVQSREPCLLVGETGTGKTSAVQYLAEKMGKKLIVVNLSQQSEAGDLLGGYKPMSLRTFALPMKEEFEEMFAESVDRSANQGFIEKVSKAFARCNWARLFSLWSGALQQIGPSFGVGPHGLEGNQAKRRKIEPSRYQRMHVRWSKFAEKLHVFEMHLKSGGKGFAFHFVEGNIVKAVRNGDWVLLDEVNLASPDTLESLSDLLTNDAENAPSIMLTETGEVERVEAHSEFRIFAAMNPATDIGKRDLPQSLRSRFTELYVPSPDRDRNSLIQIVESCLGDYVKGDPTIAGNVSDLYMEISKMEEDNKLVDGANQRPHYSLRTLTRTLAYVLEIAPLYGLRRSVYEGFCMSFLTLLNQASGDVVVNLISKYILTSLNNRRAVMKQMPRKPNDAKNYIQFEHYWMRQGPNLPVEDGSYIITPFINANLLNLVRAASSRKFPILLQGPTSSGKTSMVEYLAKISGNRFVRVNNHEHTDLQEYLGAYMTDNEGQLQFQEGVLVQALRGGHWIVLDELNLAPTDILEALNRLLDDNRELFIPETQEVVRPHENFMLFATQNPAGLYGGRKALSRAFRNRFLELHFDDIPEDELEDILEKRTRIAPSFCKNIIQVYKKLAILRQSNRLFEQRNSFATLRDLFRWALRDADDRQQLAIHGYMLLAERVRAEEERVEVQRVIEQVMKAKIDTEKVYRQPTPPTSVSNVLFESVVWTKSMRRMFVLVTEALKRKEPVLLIGGTGCGKTTICQVIAEMEGTQLHVVNAHQNTETGDLIGAQRPVRNRAALDTLLLSDFSLAARSLNFGTSQRLEDLIKAYEALTVIERDSLPDDLHARIDHHLRRRKTLFEWSDGSLVQAMKNGHHFLLDEISLADDSVLERLNSVLESGRTIMLAEKGSDTAPVTAVSKFQFLATMNPGGDFGKRELSPALRNRFTEIWIPPMSSENEIVEIAEARLIADRKKYAESMVIFAAWFGNEYRPMAPQLSIRDMLAWVDFLNVTFHVQDDIALVEGAALVFIDGLGANPAAALSLSTASINTARYASLSKLEELFHSNLTTIYHKPCRVDLTEQHLLVGEYKIERLSFARNNDNFSMQAETTRINMNRVVRALQLTKPILLEGSPGVGKTTLISALADAVGIPLTRINLSEQTDLMDLFGSDVPVEDAEAGQFAWRDAPFLQAMQRGEWVLLDEMNLASQSVLEGLNACLDHRGEVYVPELDQSFERHPSFVVFAAQNPYSQGGGRKGLPASFVNRFSVVYIDTFTSNDLIQICHERYPSVDTETIQKIVNHVQELGELAARSPLLSAAGGPWEFNLRDILRWLDMITTNQAATSMTPFEHLEQVLFLRRFRSSGAQALVCDATNLDRGFQAGHGAVYRNLSHKFYQAGLGLLERHQIFQHIRSTQTPKYLQALEAVMIGVQFRWPVLLVGPSGSGKTTLIRHVAAFVGADLVELPLSSDTDTMDIVGGYEQADIQRLTRSFLRRVTVEISSVLLRAPVATENAMAWKVWEDSLSSGTDLAAVESFLRTVLVATSDPIWSDLLQGCRSLQEKAKADQKARFEWIDGVLVEAIMQGKWIVLDHANLSSSSVIDRLNSLLEPRGVLAISEHSNADGSARIVRPHANFRIFLTMNPQHGELSRAMRNRCLEIFLPSHEMIAEFSSTTDVTDSSLFRLKTFVNSEWKHIDGRIAAPLSSLSIDQLSFSDRSLVDKLPDQLGRGLHPGTKHICKQTLDVMQWQISLNNASTMFKDQVLSFYQNSLALLFDQVHDLAQYESIHPFVNPIFLGSGSRFPMTERPLVLARVYDLRKELALLLHELSTRQENLSAGVSRPLNRLDRSLISHKDLSFSKDSTQPLASFLIESSQIIVQWLTSHLTDSKQESLRYISKIVTFLWDMFDSSRCLAFDDASFQVLLQGGRRLISEAKPPPSISDETELADLSSKLDKFNHHWRLTSGGSMVLIWQLLKRSTLVEPRTRDALAQIIIMAGKIDSLMWRAQTTITARRDLRETILRIFGNILASGEMPENLQGFIQDLEQEIHNLTTLNYPERMPYFVHVFQGIIQMQALSQHEGDSPNSLLAIVASRRSYHEFYTQGENASTNLLRASERAVGVGIDEMPMQAVRQTVLPNLAVKLHRLEEVTLGSLPLLLEETEILKSALTSIDSHLQKNPITVLNARLLSVHEVMFRLHRRNLDSGFCDSMSAKIQLLADHLEISSIGLDDKGCLNTPTVQAEQVQKIFKSHILQSLRFLERSVMTSERRVSYSASAWVAAFSGYLLLYVPDKPFDPALYGIVASDCHERRRSKLQEQLEAFEIFEGMNGLKQDTPRKTLVMAELASMSEELSTLDVYRPDRTLLRKLQSEFNVILSSVVRKIHPDRFEDIGTDSLGVLLQNTENAIARLADQKIYEDLTEPAIRLLRSLSIGLNLCKIAEGESDFASVYPEARYLFSILGIDQKVSIQKMLADQPTSVIGTKNVHSGLLYLKAVAVDHSVTGRASPMTLHAIHEVFDSFYTSWKAQLAKDQEDDATQSSLYRYRYLDDDQASLDRELQDLFPDYSETNFQGNKDYGEIDTRPHRIQEFAVTLAGLHHEIWAISTISPVAKLSQLYAQSTDDLVKLFERENGGGAVPLSASQLLPLTLSHFSRKIQNLDVLSQTREGNFYRDSNIKEAKKAMSLALKLRVRFSEIHRAWPEQASPMDVLRTVEELLDLRYSEPLAKLMTKLEQLHSFVHQWEQVASREFSAAAIYGELTDFLVSWRRLELSSWAKLLDAEDEACERDAKQWWFIAYETIVAASLSAATANKNFADHVEQLLQALGDFMVLTCIGQFRHRLNMINDFRLYVMSLSREVEVLGLLEGALRTFLAYYRRCEEIVDESVKHRRLDLEKSMKDTILLSSWKDTNIEALRASARRSHTKLFKVIRRYRSLLAEPAGPILAAYTGRVNELAGVDVACVDHPIALSEQSFALYRHSMPNWEDQPERFRNPTSTIRLIRETVSIPRAMLEASRELSSWVASVILQSAELRKETPSSAAEENKDVVQSLKSRKRRLFADVLKSIRVMGFRTNLDETAKQAQNSVPKILATSPGVTGLAESPAATNNFYLFIDNLMKSIANSKQASGDLAHNEVERCITFLQDFNDMLMGQRRHLEYNSKRCQELDSVLSTMETVSVLRKVTPRASAESIKEQIGRCKWISTVSDFTINQIEVQRQLGSKNTETIVNRVGVQADGFRSIVERYNTMVISPEKSLWHSIQEAQLEADISQAIIGFQEEIQALQEEFSSQRSTLDYLKPWICTEIQNGFIQQSRTHSGSLVELDSRMQKTIDSLLLRYQSLKRHAIPVTKFDRREKSWLVNTSRAMCDMIDSLEIGQTVTDLQSLIDFAAEFAPGPATEVLQSKYAYLFVFAKEHQRTLESYMLHLAKLHETVVYVASKLSEIFLNLLSDGFCSPSKSDAESGVSKEKLEDGTGLGEGEGAKDISKDLEEDEDLSELTQDGKRKEEEDSIDKEDNAVDMADQELEGEFDDEAEERNDEKEDRSDEADDQEREEQIDNVDDEDPEALDEKLWDGKEEQSGEDGKRGDSIEGKRDDHMTANDDKESRSREEDPEELKHDGNEDEDEEDIGQDVNADNMPLLDPQLKEEEKLDLPDDMELDGDEKSAIGSDSDDGMDESENTDEGVTNTEATTEPADGLDEPDLTDTNVVEDKDAGEDDEKEGDTMSDIVEDNYNNEPGVSDDIELEKGGDDQIQNGAAGLDGSEKQDDEMPKTQKTESATDQSNNIGTELEANNEDDQNPENAEASTGTGTAANARQDDSLPSEADSQVFKKLGDILESFQRNLKDIQEASKNEPASSDKEINTAPNQEYEHLPNEDAEHDAQALGNADKEQARGFDTFMDLDEIEEAQEPAPGIPRTASEEDMENENLDPEEELQDVVDAPDSKPPASIGLKKKVADALVEEQDEEQDLESLGSDESMNELDDGLSEIHLTKPREEATLRSVDDAQVLWQQCETATQSLALALTEQLRLILAPTLATKMRGDFRTGKRLNIKRIIPYIASQYKRDKIWMRRSIPSKRDYQIMLAIDDSKSMDEPGGGSSQLAFETLALVARSLSMLEAGQLCIVGFGEDVRVAHPFDQPFSSAVGAQVLQHFTFQQNTTDVQNLVTDSLRLFREAKAQAQGSNTELWQLQLIISDGICGNHESILRLVRQAHQERIMVVFIIVDALKGQSITSLQEASFETNPRTGQPEVKMRRYLDDFPFDYYLIVGDIRELPAVLATALRQWFSEIAEI